MTPGLDAQGFAAECGVSRETLARLEAYAALLAQWNARINLVSRDSLRDPWRRHFLDSAQLFPDVPPTPTLQGDPIEVLRARDERAAQQIHAFTAMPWWRGERLDVGWAIDVLHPLAARARMG